MIEHVGNRPIQENMEKRTSCVLIISPFYPHDIPTIIPNESEAALLGGDFHQLPPVSLDGWAFQAKAGELG